MPLRMMLYILLQTMTRQFQKRHTIVPINSNGSPTTLSIGAFSDLVSFSTRIEIPGLLVANVTVISCSVKPLC